MNNAEMRARLTLLGLSLKQLATITGWDYRELRRTANGVRAVSPRTIQMIERLEDLADNDLRAMQETVEAGSPVVIPHFSDEGHAPYFEDGGVMPGSYWHAQAGALLAVNESANVIYTEGEPAERHKGPSV